MAGSRLMSLQALTERARSQPVMHEDEQPDVMPTPPRSRESLIDAAIYVDGARVTTPTSVVDMIEQLSRYPDGIAWASLYRPGDDELLALAERFDIHELVVEDAITAHQRPKLERYDDAVFLVLRSAHYVDEREEVVFGEVHLYCSERVVVSVRHSDSPVLSEVRPRLEASTSLLAQGAQAIVYGVLDAVVDGYYPVIDGLANDIDEIEDQVFLGDPAATQRTYFLTKEIVDFERAAVPLLRLLPDLEEIFAAVGTPQMRAYLRDVTDHLTFVVERIAAFRATLRDILTVNATLVAQRQNEEMTELSRASNQQNAQVQKISGWAAILFAPSLVSGIYGMNFVLMPELDWRMGYPWALTLMLVVSGTLFVVFRRRGWI